MNTLPGFSSPTPEFSPIQPWEDPRESVVPLTRVSYAMGAQGIPGAPSDPLVQSDIDTIVSRAQGSTISSF
ncbi:MAG: hypothetical protein ACRDS0_34995 [Pseudonocardiaceae bacterium]